MIDKLKTFFKIAFATGFISLWVLALFIGEGMLNGADVLAWSAVLGLAVASIWAVWDALSDHPAFVTRWYNIYAGVLGALLIVAMYRGWGFAAVEKIHNVPKSVRDNPGAYRSHYRTYSHYTGGK
jgi:hypothetical protein